MYPHFEIQKLSAAYGRQAAFHFRYTPGTEVTEANGIQELLANAAALGAPAVACHFNNPGYNLVHELLERMRERGMNVWGELYPYIAGCTAWTDETLQQSEEMYGMTWKRGETLSGFVLHNTHHRGQMTVRMRQAGLKPPGIYGPAKEDWAKMGMEPPSA